MLMLDFRLCSMRTVGPIFHVYVILVTAAPGQPHPAGHRRTRGLGVGDDHALRQRRPRVAGVWMRDLLHIYITF
jgi:hypothetical protein